MAWGVGQGWTNSKQTRTTVCLARKFSSVSQVILPPKDSHKFLTPLIDYQHANSIQQCIWFKPSNPWCLLSIGTCQVSLSRKVLGSLLSVCLHLPSDFQAFDSIPWLFDSSYQTSGHSSSGGSTSHLGQILKDTWAHPSTIQCNRWTREATGKLATTRFNDWKPRLANLYQLISNMFQECIEGMKRGSL